MNGLENYYKSVKLIMDRLDGTAEIGLILGSGLGGIADSLKDSITLDYGEIGFPLSGAPGHEGKLIYGKLLGKNVVCMKGRLHYYEGHSPLDIIFPVRVMRQLGVKTLIITNSAGGINTSFEQGDIMMITDHINLTGTNPLIGKNDEVFGKRFFDMGHIYSEKYFSLAEKAAADNNIKMKKGVYLGCSGPSFETPAEIRAFRTLGADAVGMSTVFEVIAAAQMKMEVAAFSMITNMAAGVIPEQVLSGDDVNETAQSSGKKLQKLIEAIITGM